MGCQLCRAIPPSSWLYDRGNFRDAIVRIWRKRFRNTQRIMIPLADLSHVTWVFQSLPSAVAQTMKNKTPSAHRPQPSATSPDCKQWSFNSSLAEQKTTWWSQRSKTNRAIRWPTGLQGGAFNLIQIQTSFLFLKCFMHLAVLCHTCQPEVIIHQLFASLSELLIDFHFKYKLPKNMSHV